MRLYRFPSFGGLKSFYAVALSGSVRVAAQRLGVSPSSVSHQVKSLEEELGVRLLQNRKGRLYLTADGKQYFEAINGPLSQLLTATEEIRSRPGRKRVSLTLTPSFAAGWLMRLLGEFQKENPDLELDLIATTAVVDLERESVDLAIRRGKGDWSNCIAEPLIREVIVPVIAPRLWKSLKCRTLEQAIGRARVLVNTTVPEEWGRFCEARKIPLPPAARCFNLETYELTIQAACDGLGIALGRKPLIDNLVESRELIVPFATEENRSSGYFVVRRSEEMRSDVRRVHAWLMRHKA